jgi:hypothetical protein
LRNLNGMWGSLKATGRAKLHAPIYGGLGMWVLSVVPS